MRDSQGAGMRQDIHQLQANFYPQHTCLSETFLPLRATLYLMPITTSLLSPQETTGRGTGKPWGGNTEWELYKYRNGLAFDLSRVVTLVFILQPPPQNELSQLRRGSISQVQGYTPLTSACDGSWGACGLALRLSYTVIPAWDIQNTAHTPPLAKKNDRQIRNNKYEKAKLKPFLIPLPQNSQYALIWVYFHSFIGGGHDHPFYMQVQGLCLHTVQNLIFTCVCVYIHRYVTFHSTTQCKKLSTAACNHSEFDIQMYIEMSFYI